MNEREAYIALNMMDRIGPVGVRAMVSVAGSAADLFSMAQDDLVRMFGGKNLTSSLLKQRDTVPWECELARVDSMGARIVTQIDPEYPQQLLEIHDPPLALYVRGSIEKRDKHGIAVVGTRRPSHYGREAAANLSRQLARTGITVISGLAQGIDTVAHEAALSVQGRTLAVMGSALDCLYPSSNAKLAESIANNGAVISEFPLGRHPDKTTFPMRNRIVSGLSMGVLVVEAGEKSGALITAHQALDQGRSVFAVPGRIDSHLSRGGHALIKKGAQLVESVDDILHEFEFLLPERIQENSVLRNRPAPELNDDERKIVSLLIDGEQGIDGLIRSSGLKSSQVSSLLIGLEMKRVIRMLPGGMVERK